MESTSGNWIINMDEESEESVDFGQVEVPDEDLLGIDLDLPTTSSNINIPSKEEKREYIQGQKNVRTTAKTKGAVNQFNVFLSSQGLGDVNIEQMEQSELNEHLENFFVTLRKKDGDEYEPGTLRGIFASINRYLQEKRYDGNLQTSTQFQGVRQIVAAKFKVNIQMKMQGNSTNCLKMTMNTDK